MDLASVVAALASVGVRVSGSAPNSSVQVDSWRACPPGLAGPEPSGTINDLGQHFHYFLLALVLAPRTSLAATFARCPFRARVVTCNILVSFPPTLMCPSPLALPTCVWRGPGVR